MEGIPRISMFAVPLKPSPVSPDISPIKKKIRKMYGEQMHIDENIFQSFLAIRTSSCKAPTDISSIDNIKRYYSHLLLLKNRINLNEPKFVEWPWQDAFGKNSFVRTEIEYEEAATLYNLGATHSLLGQQELRIEPNSMKVACTHFQCAAWAFQTLRDRYGAFDDANDMHSDLLRVYYLIMLNQAQECITEKSIIDNRPPNITAKLLKYLSESYEHCLSLIQSQHLINIIPSKLMKEWKRRLSVKASLYTALTDHYASLSEATDMKYGASIAFLKVAQDRITETTKMVSNLNDFSNPQIGPKMIATVHFARDVIVESYKNAVSDNNLIYHEKVPSVNDLSVVKSACLAKPVPFDHTDPGVIGEDIFKHLLPIETLEASSMYSEMKANYLRAVLAEVEEKDAELAAFLSSLNLDPAYLCKTDGSLPQELLDVCAQLSAMDPSPLQELSSRMSALVNVSVDVETDLEDLDKAIQDERDNINKLKKSLTNTQVTDADVQLMSLSEKFVKFSEAANQAKNSNMQIHSALNEHLKAVRTLLLPLDQIESKLPSVKDLIADDQLLKGLDEAARILSKVEDMRAQRSELIERLRTALQTDDVATELLASVEGLDTGDQSGKIDALFAKRLRMHDDAASLIRLNLAAQENICKVLIELHARVAVQKHAILEQRQRRDDEIESLVRSNDTFSDLMSKCDEGQAFYKQLAERLSKMQSEVFKIKNDISTMVVETPKIVTSHIYPPPTVQTFASTNDYANNTQINQNTFLPSISSAQSVPTSTDRPKLRDFLKVRDTQPNARRNLQMPSKPPFVVPTTGPQYPEFPSITSPIPSSRFSVPRLFGEPYRQPYTPSTFSITNTINSPHLYQIYPENTRQSYPQTVQPVGVCQNVINSPYYTQVPGQYFQETNINIEQRTQSTAACGKSMPRLWNPSVSTSSGSPRLQIPGNVSRSYINSAQYNNNLQWPQTTGIVPTTSNANFPGQSCLRYCSQAPTYPNIGQLSVSQYESQSNTGPQVVLQTNNAYHKMPNKNNFTQPQAMFMRNDGSNYMRIPTQQPMQNYMQAHVHPVPTSSHLYYVKQPQLTQLQQQAQQMPQGNLPIYMPAPTQPQQNSCKIESMQARHQLPTQPQHHTYQPTSIQSQPPTQTQLETLLPQPTDGNQSISTEPPPPTKQQSARTITKLPWMESPQSCIAPRSVKDQLENQHIIEIPALKANTLKSISDRPISPQVLTEADLEVQRREKQLRAAYNTEKGVIVHQPSSETNNSSKCDQALPMNGYMEKNTNTPAEEPDTFSDPLVVSRFVNATERLLSWIENMSEPLESPKPSSKPSSSRLDEAWSFVNEMPGKRPMQAIARCCSGKNRSNDCIPYDINRVLLANNNEDYINASHLEFVSSLGAWCPRYILTQAPLINTVADFWQMIFEQHCEIVVVLLPSRPLSNATLPATLDPSDTEGAFGDPSNKLRVPPYLPPLKIGSRLCLPSSKLDLRLQAVKFTKHENLADLTVVDCISKATCVERVLSIHNRDTQHTRSIVHLCYSGEVTETESLAAFIQLAHTFYKNQRNLTCPIAVVSETGGCMGGVFVTASVAMLQAEAVCRLADVCEIAQKVNQQRKGALDKPAQLVAAFAIVGHAAKAALARRDIVVGPSIYVRPCSASSRSTKPVNQKTEKPENFTDNLFSNQPMQMSELITALGSWGEDTKKNIKKNAMKDTSNENNATTLQTKYKEKNKSEISTESAHFSVTNATEGQTKRCYQPREFVDNEWRNIRDTVLAESDNIFTDLDPFVSIPTPKKKDDKT